MRIELKATRYEVLEDVTLRVYTNTEDFKAMLDHHSPNILIEYLNDNYGPLQTSPDRGGFKIAHIAPPSGGWGAGRKEDGNGNV